MLSRFDFRLKANPLPRGSALYIAMVLWTISVYVRMEAAKPGIKHHPAESQEQWMHLSRLQGMKECDPSGVDFLQHLGSATLISPLELIRTKMQFRPLSYKELTQCIQMSVANEGWLSLWKGWGPTVLRDVPFSAMYWYNYELGKKWLCQRYNKLEPTFTISFTAGAMSGSIAAVVTLPFDVVKTRRQVELGELESLKNSPKRSSSTWKIMYRIISENGFQGLFAVLFNGWIFLAHTKIEKTAPAHRRAAQQWHRKREASNRNVTMPEQATCATSPYKKRTCT
ncbi:mitochondrial glutathione transporter SLC25A40 isoform X4 [Aquarana catesbeiana]|uniref:mitochondrial glutathione transporter SLC25A40 isoform X4 n=1 Tax=Aquarana catesbeiana TaxID=8400 RepID=UPI003CC98FBB